MSNFSKITIIILVILSFFYINEKYGKAIKISFPPLKSLFNIELTNKNQQGEDEIVKKPVEIGENNTNDKKEKEYTYIYFLALDSDDNGIYKKVQREVPSGENKLDYAIKELLKGPNIIEKSSGAYSEIPKSTKLLSIKETKEKIIIDLSSDFETGGGTDSIYSRMMQLVKTSINNTDNKKIYLYIEGNQVNLIGGEGIMITQPLTENSLEI